jgi:glycerol uptake facilitator protein
LASSWARWFSFCFGNGVNAAVTLRKSYAADSGWMVITTGWALGVLCGVMVAQAFGSGAANLNPAITLAGRRSHR